MGTVWPDLAALRHRSTPAGIGWNGVDNGVPPIAPAPKGGSAELSGATRHERANLGHRSVPVNWSSTAVPYRTQCLQLRHAGLCTPNARLDIGQWRCDGNLKFSQRELNTELIGKTLHLFKNDEYMLPFGNYNTVCLVVVMKHNIVVKKPTSLLKNNVLNFRWLKMYEIQFVDLVQKQS